MHALRTVWWFVVTVALLAGPAAPGARAATGTAPRSADFDIRTGGVGSQERTQLLDLAPRYSLVVSFASRKNGAMLSNVDVTITGQTLQRPITLATHGPLLLASLPPGHYRLEAHVGGWHDRLRDVDLEPRSHQRLYVTFVPYVEGDHRNSANT